MDNYIPNQSSLLPPQLATDLFNAGRSRDQQPAGTYAREVLEQLAHRPVVVVFAPGGQQQSLLDTKSSSNSGSKVPLDEDTLMLFNHKNAIEFMVDRCADRWHHGARRRRPAGQVDEGPLEGLAGYGSIRRRLVNIDGSVYSPSNIPTLLEETLKSIIDKVPPYPKTR